MTNVDAASNSSNIPVSSPQQHIPENREAIPTSTKDLVPGPPSGESEVRDEPEEITGVGGGKGRKGRRTVGMSGGALERGTRVTRSRKGTLDTREDAPDQGGQSNAQNETTTRQRRTRNAPDQRTGKKRGLPDEFEIPYGCVVTLIDGRRGTFKRKL